jgi:mannose-6-phosphate isomerase-like protein (cupin superfamily)
MKHLLWVICVYVIRIGAVPAQEPHLMRLGLHSDFGAKETTFRFAHGTVVRDATFYDSGSSDLAVGRAYLNGPVLPSETTDYTDVFLVVHGSGNLQTGGKVYRLRVGDLVLLPRGVKFEGADMHHYIHFFASFERKKDDSFNGPLVARILHPENLVGQDFVKTGKFMRHVYYRGRGDVVVAAIRYPEALMESGFTKTANSELMFVIHGSGTISDDHGRVVHMRPRAAIFVPKGAAVRRRIAGLYALVVLFDRSEASTESR